MNQFASVLAVIMKPFAYETTKPKWKYNWYICLLNKIPKCDETLVGRISWKFFCGHPVKVTAAQFKIDCLSIKSMLDPLTHWGRVTHICVSKLTIIGSDNGLSPGRGQAIIWTNAGILLIRTLGTKFREILSEIHAFSLKKMHLKMSSAK